MHFIWLSGDWWKELGELSITFFVVGAGSGSVVSGGGGGGTVEGWFHIAGKGGTTTLHTHRDIKGISNTLIENTFLLIFIRIEKILKCHPARK
jgi:hypothetical protein